ncbi:MAG TPA: hypothetical protein ENG87_04750 [Candidatus Pacearchaeota archaeon]|nr:hypothetical protein BMS3Abin17_00810 [archaeon BMS3Abin17]HDK42666.1 hypothetical protein [Candidatus Pacearchaeota archaeon]HDZ60095.1 hypothetical protein [Candidatus Pacearchaeota archaeon]
MKSEDIILNECRKRCHDHGVYLTLYYLQELTKGGYYLGNPEATKDKNKTIDKIIRKHCERCDVATSVLT